MNQRRSKPVRFTRFQRLVLASIGAAMIAGGVATLFSGGLLFHFAVGHPLGWIFAPFALIVGALFILFAIRLGKQE
jgi:hypothetical protein